MTDETRLILEKLDGINTRLDKVDARLDKVETRLDKVDARLDKVEGKVTELQLTLENETNKNIRIIAEGHLDLSRRFDDALRVESEKEMLLVRMNRMETEIRRMKKQIEEIAQRIRSKQETTNGCLVTDTGIRFMSRYAK